MGAAWTIRRRTDEGLQPIKFRRDLGEVADLIELCFADIGAPDLRSVVGEMRTMAKLGPLLSIWGGMQNLWPAMGYVWRENGHVIGNVSIFRAEAPPEMGAGWVIANVAVHPDRRRRGIAREMMIAALEYISRRGGWAALQVERDNEAALALYHSLGFREEGAWSLWYRPPGLKASRASYGVVGGIAPLKHSDWRAEYELARIARPTGMGWLKPVLPRYFKRSFLTDLLGLLGLRWNSHWAVWDCGRLVGVVILQRRLDMHSDELTLLVHPDRRGELESQMVSFVISRCAGRSIRAEHPADDDVATSVLKDTGFRLRRTLIYMRIDVREGKV